MRKHGPEELLLRGLHTHRKYEPLDQFGDLGSDHVGAEELPGFGVEEGFGGDGEAVYYAALWESCGVSKESFRL